MPLQNRVTPTGEIVADPARGMFMGNRGILHDDHARLTPRRWRHPNWVTCALAFRGRKRLPMRPGAYTELFFLDEAVALAAGHRPCGECRRRGFQRFLAFWQRAHGGETPRRVALDRALHRARIRPRSREQQRYPAELAGLPDGTFILWRELAAPLLVDGDRLLPYAPAGYRPPLARPRGAAVTVLTPSPTVATLAAGYRPALHPTAGR